MAGASSASQGHETKSAGRHAAADKVWTDVDVNKVDGRRREQSGRRRGRVDGPAYVHERQLIILIFIDIY